MYLYSFEKLNVWQKSVDLVETIYKISSNFPKEEKYDLTSHMRKCVVSISSNLAEGTSRITSKDKAHFFYNCIKSYNGIVMPINNLEKIEFYYWGWIYTDKRTYYEGFQYD